MAKAFDDLEDVKVSKQPRDRLMIVDGFNLAFRYKWRSKAKHREEQKAEAAQHLRYLKNNPEAASFESKYEELIKSLAKSYRAKDVVVCSDWGYSSFRSEIYPEYKANRAAARLDQSEEEQEIFSIFLDEWSKAMSKIEESFPLLRYKNVEADDLAACVADLIGHNYNGTTFISSDRDWLQLLRKEEDIWWSFTTRKEITIGTWYQFYKFPFEAFLTFKCLSGDSGDNVPGISGIGEVRATNLIDTYGDIYGILESLPLKGTAKYIKALNESAELLRTNLDLFDLYDNYHQAIGFDNLREIKEKLLEQ